MISGISGISSTPGIISNISAASLDRISSIKRTTRQAEDELILSGDEPIELLGSNNDSDLVILGNPDDSETAYGLPLNELRRQSNLRQLSGEDDDETSSKSKSNPTETASATDKNNQLSTEEKAQVQELKARDQEVRTHEMAHLAAAGQYASSGASYSYQTGPDGKQYAIGGEVSIDTSPAKTPEETIAKMRQVQAAAMAPAQPSGQDRAVAASAAKAIADAQVQASQAQMQSNNKNDSAKPATSTTAKSNNTSETKTVNAEKNEAKNLSSLITDELAAPSIMVAPENLNNEGTQPISFSPAEPIDPATAVNNIINKNNNALPTKVAKLSYQQSRALQTYRLAS